MCSMLLLLHDAPGAGLCDAAAAAAGFSISTHRGFRFSHHEGGDALASLGLNWGGELLLICMFRLLICISRPV